MQKYNVEEVFKTAGFPDITYVQPKEYLTLVVAMRTRGKCVVVEGPSGIGKTTAVLKVLKDLDDRQKCQILSARKPTDLPAIKKVSEGDFSGTILIDDFHRLESTVREGISNVMKYMADDPAETRKIVVIGINSIGDSLVHFSSDLNNRISTIRFETNPDEKVEELIKKGEVALNFEFDSRTTIIEKSRGSFHIAQLMCQKACIQGNVLCTCEEKQMLHFSYPAIMSEMTDEFSRSFFSIAREFATGNKLRREGRAPYLHILKWLSESDTWSLNLTNAIQQHPKQKAGVIQVVEKGYLEDFLKKHKQVSEYIHFDPASRMLSVEDPKFLFFLKAINWNNFAKDIGFLQLVEEPKYDFALSFAGPDRRIAEKIYTRLTEEEIAVFYDKNEQVSILSQDIEEFLYPIYQSEAAYVVPLLSKDYPNRVWTRFESKAFKNRFGQNAVIPIWFDDVDESVFDFSRSYGGIVFHSNSNEDDEVAEIVSLLAKKIAEYRNSRTNNTLVHV